MTNEEVVSSDAMKHVQVLAAQKIARFIVRAVAVLMRTLFVYGVHLMLNKAVLNVD